MNTGNIQTLKTLVNSNYTKFIVAKKDNDRATIISPFEFKNNRYNSGLVLPANRMQRAQSFYSMIPEVCELAVSNGEINIDCINILTQNDEYILPKEDGWILYDYNIVQKNDEESVLNLSPKKVFLEFILKQETMAVGKIKFKAERLKVFPIIMDNGFILSIVEPTNKISTYVIIDDPSTGFVGSCGNREANEVFNFLLPLWGGDMFTINISNGVGNVFINKNVCGSFNEPSSSLVLMVRDINSEYGTIQKIADQFYPD